MALPPPTPHALILPRVKCHAPSAALSVPPAAPQSPSRRARDLSHDSSQLTQGELSISSPASPTRMLVSPGGGTSCPRAALSWRLRLSTARGHSDHLWDRTERGGSGRRSRGQCPQSRLVTILPSPSSSWKGTEPGSWKKAAASTEQYEYFIMQILHKSAEPHLKEEMGSICQRKGGLLSAGWKVLEGPRELQT